MRFSKALLTLAFLLAPGVASAATCFAVAAGSITPVNTAMWASSSGGTPGTCAAVGGVPISGDVATWDANSGTGTYTLNWGGTWTVGTITWNPPAGGTFDNSANNNPLAVGTINLNGTNTRTFNCGTATYTMTGNATFTTSPSTNLTFNCASANITFVGSSTNVVTLNLGGVTTYGNVTLGPTTGQSGQMTIAGGGTMASLTIQVPQRIVWGSGTTTTITTAVSWAGSASGQILNDVSSGSPATIALATGSSITLASYRSITFTGNPSCINCVFSNTSGATQTFPAAGGGGRIIGG